jgi:hypothetical protein
VVAPYATHVRRYAVTLGKYTVEAFPFVEGKTGFETSLSDEKFAEAARLIAAVHERGLALLTEAPLRETYENPFEKTILRAIEAARALVLISEQQRWLRQLLLREERSVLDGLDRMRLIGRKLWELELDQVLTHGDPNMDNFILDPAGRLHLVDWIDVGAGPRERDLFFFTGGRFTLALENYRAIAGHVRLHVQAFAFYEWRWTMQEIADYTTRIIFDSTHPEAQEHARQELGPYLPIQLDRIEQKIAEIGAVLARVHW